MASFFNSLFLADENEWLDEMADDESVPVDAYINDEDQPLQDGNREMKPPEIIGILPIRNTVAYPGTVTPLAIGRQRSKALLAETEPNQTPIGLLTQRRPDIDEPRFKDLYSVGTLASVLKVVKMPQGSINIFAHGLARFRIKRRITSKPYLKAKIEVLDVKARMGLSMI